MAVDDTETGSGRFRPSGAAGADGRDRLYDRPDDGLASGVGDTAGRGPTADRDYAGHDRTAPHGRHESTDRAKQQARQTVDKARHQLQSMLNGQKDAATGQIEGVAKALRSSAEQLRSQDQASAATYVETAADSLRQWCEALRKRDIDSLAGEVQTFARRQPAMFLAGTAFVGFAATRFLKSSTALEADRSSEPRALPHEAGTHSPSTPVAADRRSNISDI